MNETNDYAIFLVSSAQGDHWAGHLGRQFDVFLVIAAGNHGCSRLCFFFLAISSIPLSSVVPDTHFGRVFHLSYGLQEMKAVQKSHMMRLPRAKSHGFQVALAGRRAISRGMYHNHSRSNQKGKKRAVRSIRAASVVNIL